MAGSQAEKKRWDETATGTRDRRGHWWPKEPAGIAPLFVLPPRPRAFLRWLPSYFLPWNVLFLLSGALFWWIVTPDVETMAHLAPAWILWILFRNAVAVGLFYGALELPLYMRRRQGTRLKYNPAFPEDRENGVFWWKSQTWDNAARTFLFASHPLLAIYHLHYAGFGAAIGHIGFFTIETDENHGVDTHAFTHYLHHKYFEVNYGEGLVPIDKWMGTWHDGSEEGERQMEARRAMRRKVG